MLQQTDSDIGSKTGGGQEIYDLLFSGTGLRLGTSELHITELPEGSHW